MLFGAIALLLRGRRTNVDVTATLHSDGQTSMLDVRAKMNPVASFSNSPYEPLPCEGCATHRRNKNPSDSWFISSECPRQSFADRFTRRDIRMPTFRKRGGGMRRRRSKWGCPNRKVASLEVRKVVHRPKSGNLEGFSEETCGWILHAFRGHFAEPQENLQVTHLIPVDASDPSVLGWKVILRVRVPKETWFLSRPSADSWGWDDDEFVSNSLNCRPT